MCDGKENHHKSNAVSVQIKPIRAQRVLIEVLLIEVLLIEVLPRTHTS